MKRPISPFVGAGIKLRLAQTPDLPRMLAWRNRDEARVWFRHAEALEWAAHMAWFERYQARDDDFLFIVEADGVPVGQASVYGIGRSRGEAEVGRFLVAPEAAGRGHIKAACDALIEFCRSDFGLRYLFLEVLEDNQRAIGLYRKNGFAEESRRDGLIRMGRHLVSAEPKR